MQHATGDETADHLLKYVQLMKRTGTREMRANADRWELIIRTHAEPTEQVPLAVNFATANPNEEEKQ